MLVNLFSIEMPDPKAIDKAINEKFVSKDKFAEEIEKIVLDTQMSYIDAVCQYCEDNNIEVASAPKLISKVLKEKIKYEATELNYLKKTTRGKLPL